MAPVQLTLKSIRARPVVVPLKRPVVSKVGLFQDWPLILIDLYTNEGVVGHSYLEPYLKKSARYIVPMLEDLAEAAKGQPLAPFDGYRQAMGSLHLIGREGVSLIAASGLDMAAWDSLAKAADMPLAVFLGGTVGPVPAYNSNGLWLTPVEKLAAEAAALVAEGAFTGLKLRLGRETLADDLAAIAAVREAAGGTVKLMCDFNQGLSLGDALVRCHALDDHGLYWFEEPTTYDNIPGYVQLAGAEDSRSARGEFLRRAPAVSSGARRRGRLRHARPDAHWGCHRMAARGSDHERRRHSDVHSLVP
jgi:mandelate racemase